MRLSRLFYEKYHKSIIEVSSHKSARFQSHLHLPEALPTMWGTESHAVGIAALMRGQRLPKLRAQNWALFLGSAKQYNLHYS